MASDCEHAQQLLNLFAPDQIAAVVHVMEVMLDPLARKLANAPPPELPSGRNTTSPFRTKRSSPSSASP